MALYVFIVPKKKKKKITNAPQDYLALEWSFMSPTIFFKLNNSTEPLYRKKHNCQESQAHKFEWKY